MKNKLRYVVLMAIAFAYFYYMIKYVLRPEPVYVAHYGLCKALILSLPFVLISAVKYYANDLRAFKRKCFGYLAAFVYLTVTFIQSKTKV